MLAGMRRMAAGLVGAFTGKVSAPAGTSAPVGATKAPKGATKAAVIYSKSAKIFRRALLPDSDTEVANLAVLTGTGEAAVTISYTDAQAQKFLADLAAAEGTTVANLGNPRCAVVDNATNLVVRVICADPLIDSLTGFTIVPHANANIGWNYIGNGKFTEDSIKFVRMLMRAPSEI